MFKVHGTIKTKWIDDCYLIKPVGPINKEGAMSFNQTIEKDIVTSGVDEWFRLECLHGQDTMGSPEVYDLLAESLSWSLQHGCRLTILAGSSTLNQEMFKKACAKVNMPYFWFEDLECALQFCRDFD